jgi:hypothetical protein
MLPSVAGKFEMLSRQAIIDRTLDLVKSLAHRLEEIRGVSVTVIIPNGGMGPDIMIRFIGPAYHNYQIEADIDLFRLDGSDGQEPVHIDVGAIDGQQAEFLLDIHENLESFDEISVYVDKVIALYREIR